MLSFTELKVNQPEKIPFCSAAEEHCGLPNPGSLSHHNRNKVFVLCGCCYSVSSNLFIRQRDTYRLKYYFLKKYSMFILN